MSTLRAVPIYMTGAFADSLDSLCEVAGDALANVDYDTLVTSGLSGSLVVPTVARALGKHFLIVRKDNDGAHDWRKVAGTLGNRWVFFDDFVDSGATLERCKRAVAGFARDSAHDTTFVGDYSYRDQWFTEAGWQDYENEPEYEEPEPEGCDCSACRPEDYPEED